MKFRRILREQRYDNLVVFEPKPPQKLYKMLLYRLKKRYFLLQFPTL